MRMGANLPAQEQTERALARWAVAEYAFFSATVHNIEVGLGLAQGCSADLRPTFLRQTFAALRRTVRRPPLILCNN